MACMFMNDQHAIENMKRYPEQIRPFIDAEIRLSHTWKKGKSLEELWNQCHDIDDVVQIDTEPFAPQEETEVLVSC